MYSPEAQNVCFIQVPLDAADLLFGKMGNCQMGIFPCIEEDLSVFTKEGFRGVGTHLKLGGRRHFEVDSFHATSRGVMLKSENVEDA